MQTLIWFFSISFLITYNCIFLLYSMIHSWMAVFLCYMSSIIFCLYFQSSWWLSLRLQSRIYQFNTFDFCTHCYVANNEVSLDKLVFFFNLKLRVALYAHNAICWFTLFSCRVYSFQTMSGKWGNLWVKCISSWP